MSINRIRRVKNSSYTVVSNTISRDKRLTLKAKGFMLVVMSLPDDWDFSIEGMKAILKEGRDSLYSTIAELKQFGYCEAIPVKKEGKFAGYDYSFFEQPVEEKPQTENPYTENPPQISKEINNYLPKELTKKEILENKLKEDRLWLKREMNNYAESYDKETLNKFYLYWTEKNRSGTSLRYKSEPFFEVSRRLNTWKNNSNKTYIKTTIDKLDKPKGVPSVTTKELPQEIVNSLMRKTI